MRLLVQLPALCSFDGLVASVAAAVVQLVGFSLMRNAQVVRAEMTFAARRTAGEPLFIVFCCVVSLHVLPGVVRVGAVRICAWNAVVVSHVLTVKWEK